MHDMSTPHLRPGRLREGGTDQAAAALAGSICCAWEGVNNPWGGTRAPAVSLFRPKQHGKKRCLAIPCGCCIYRPQSRFVLNDPPKLAQIPPKNRKLLSPPHLACTRSPSEPLKSLQLPNFNVGG